MAGTSDLDVAYVARLARINLTQDEAKIFQKQLDDVLKYVEKLGEVDVTGLDAAAIADRRCSAPANRSQSFHHFGDDKKAVCLPGRVAQRLLRCEPIARRVVAEHVENR